MSRRLYNRGSRRHVAGCHEKTGDFNAKARGCRDAEKPRFLNRKERREPKERQGLTADFTDDTDFGRRGTVTGRRKLADSILMNWNNIRADMWWH